MLRYHKHMHTKFPSCDKAIRNLQILKIKSDADFLLYMVELKFLRQLCEGANNI
jgi:hypothetical protein